MAKPFPDHPNTYGVNGYAPIQMECDALNLVIEGQIVPSGLEGDYFIGSAPILGSRAS